MTTNFEFLKTIDDPEINDKVGRLYNYCAKVEKYSFGTADTAEECLSSARVTMELITNIYLQKKTGKPSNLKLGKMLKTLSDNGYLKRYLYAIREVKDFGNIASHGDEIINWRTSTIKAVEDVYKVVANVCLELGYIEKVAQYREPVGDIPITTPTPEEPTPIKSEPVPEPTPIPEEPVKKEDELHVFFVIDASEKMADTPIHTINVSMPKVMQLIERTCSKFKITVDIKFIISSDSVNVLQTHTWSPLQANGNGNLSDAVDCLAKELEVQSPYTSVVILVTSDTQNVKSLPAKTPTINIGMCIGKTSQSLQDFVTKGNVKDEYGTILDQIGLRFSYTSEPGFTYEFPSIVKSAVLSSIQKIDPPFIDVSLNTTKD